MLVGILLIGLAAFTSNAACARSVRVQRRPAAVHTLGTLLAATLLATLGAALVASTITGLPQAISVFIVAWAALALPVLVHALRAP